MPHISNRADRPLPGIFIVSAQSFVRILGIAATYSCQNGLLGVGGMFMPFMADTPQNRVGAPKCHEELMTKVYDCPRLQSELNLL